MKHYLVIVMTCFMVGISFFIMATGMIKNRFIVYGGALLFILALVFFLIGLKDVLLI